MIGECAAQQINGLFKLDAALGQAALVEGVALNEVVFENLGGPFTKLHATLGFHPVANRDDHVQIVVINFPLNLTLALLANYPEFPDSWLVVSVHNYRMSWLFEGDFAKRSSRVNIASFGHNTVF